MKLVVMGTGPFAAPMFESLAASQYEVAALITKPVRAGKTRGKIVNPMEEAAARLGVVSYAPESANSEETRELLRDLAPDVLVVCDYGQILAPEILAVPPRGGINLHGSLLPKYRGAAPIQWALLKGDEETGVTVIHMTPALDAGPILSVRKISIEPEETHEQLEPRLAALGVEPVHEALALLENWDGASPIGQLQDAALASRAPRLKKSHGRIDWSRTTKQIQDQVRALKPWPGAFTFLPQRKGDPQRLLIEQVCAIESPHDPRPAGAIVESDTSRLWIRTGDGVLSIERLQPAGKRKMEIAEYLRGRQPAVGLQLDPQNSLKAK